jgi:hypothetical protein
VRFGCGQCMSLYWIAGKDSISGDITGFHHLDNGGIIYELACLALPRASSMTLTPSTHLPSPPKRSTASALCTESKRRSVARPPIFAAKFAWAEPDRSSTSSEAGWRVALTGYVDDGILEIDNNSAERALRFLAMGRKRLFVCRVRLRRREGRGPLLDHRLDQAQLPRSGILSRHRTRLLRRFPALAALQEVIQRTTVAQYLDCPSGTFALRELL